jgi:DNA polymerase-3 subunit gamma/tau
VRRSIRLEIEIQGGPQNTPAQQQQREAESRQAAAVDAIESDPNVKAIQKAFDATLHSESIRPLDSQ